MDSLSIILKENRMVMLEDLVEGKGSLVDVLAKEHSCDVNFVSKTRPKYCTKCRCEDIVGVEVMGSYDGILLWECESCEHTVLRFKKELTEKYLQLAKGLWTNPSDWGYVPPSKFN
tara:strand:- start:106 stop:453 length:348 start_codon:yes stop_codon:yes gene_type:complete